SLTAPRLPAPVAVGPGDIVGLGESGPRFEIAAVTERPPLPPTLPERPGLPAGARAYSITLLDAVTGRRYEASGVRIRIGRGRECEIQVAARADTTVSRAHAELDGGPERVVAALVTAPQLPVARAAGQRRHGVVRVIGQALSQAREERRQGSV